MYIPVVLLCNKQRKHCYLPLTDYKVSLEVLGEILHTYNCQSKQNYHGCHITRADGVFIYFELFLTCFATHIYCYKHRVLFALFCGGQIIKKIIKNS